MNNSVIKVENLSKEYRFGVIGHGTLYKDLQSWWARMRGKEDPNSKISLQRGPARTGASPRGPWWCGFSQSIRPW